MFADPHVHLRDFKQKRKETIQHGLEVARDSGVVAVFDMPNTDPPILAREQVVDRLRIAREADVEGVFYGLYMGLTADQEQVSRAIDLCREFPEVVGMKLYAGHSVGELGVTRAEDQHRIYDTLAREGYHGVLVVHAEEESEMHHHLWTPDNPISHCHARPEKAEIESVRQQISIAGTQVFKGKLHIAHISSPDAVDLVVAARERGMDISSGICPHHLIYDWQRMYGPDGVRMKMNPPLRSPESRAKMLQHLREGNIDWLETDHAPHTIGEKDGDPFMSGIPGLPWWPLFAEYLRSEDFSDEMIRRLTCDATLERFGIEATRSKRRVIDRSSDYAFNPYELLPLRD